MVDRVMITEAAAALAQRLRARHGDLLVHQSSGCCCGCCDGSAPMCYPIGEVRTGEQDIRVGDIAGCPFFIGVAQFEYWQHTQLIIDVVKGRGSGFFLEAPEGMRFLTRSRLFIDQEAAALAADGLPPRGGD